LSLEGATVNGERQELAEAANGGKTNDGHVTSLASAESSQSGGHGQERKDEAQHRESSDSLELVRAVRNHGAGANITDSEGVATSFAASGGTCRPQALSNVNGAFRAENPVRHSQRNDGANEAEHQQRSNQLVSTRGHGCRKKRESLCTQTKILQDLYLIQIQYFR